MIRYRKKLLTNTLSIMIAGLFGVESFAAGVPLRGVSNLSKEQINTASQNIHLKGGVKIDNKEQLITLKLVNSDLRQVLRMLADKAGKNIIIDDSVGMSSPGSSGPGMSSPISSPSPSGMGMSSPMGTPGMGMSSPVSSPMSTPGSSGNGKINLDLVNVTVNKAFEYIMTIQQLTYWQDGNTIIVATAQQASKLGLNKIDIKPIKIKYVDAKKVADFLNSNIFNLNKPDISKSSIVTSNPSTNEVYIFGSDNDYKMAKQVIAHLDTKPQVNTFNVNYTEPLSLASKICMTVFQDTSASSSGGSSSSASSSSSSGSSSAGGSSSGGTPSVSSSQLTTVCSGSGTGSGSSPGGSAPGSSLGGSPGSSSSGSSGGQALSAFSSNSYMVLADPGLNQITLYGGTQEQINLAQDLIKNFDKKEPQVYLEISIIELSEDGSKTLSTEWINKAGTDNFGFSASTLGTPSSQGVAAIRASAGSSTTVNGVTTLIPAIAAADAQPGIPGLAGAPGTLTWINNAGANLAFPKAKDFATVITSIITNGKGRILSNPRIIASNNVASKIDISEDIVAGIKTETTTSTATTTTQSVIQGTVGITLSVTPRISPNGYVTLNMNPSYSSVKGDDGHGGTLKRTRDFTSSNIRVKDGETLVIAGLVQESETNQQSKTPLLADIPIIGTLFKNQATTKSRSELIFMITPRIIQDKTDEKAESI